MSGGSSSLERQRRPRVWENSLELGTLEVAKHAVNEAKPQEGDEFFHSI